MGPLGHKVIQLKRKKVQTIVVIYKIRLCTLFEDVAARESIQYAKIAYMCSLPKVAKLFISIQQSC